VVLVCGTVNFPSICVQQKLQAWLVWVEQLLTVGMRDVGTIQSQAPRFMLIIIQMCVACMCVCMCMCMCVCVCCFCVPLHEVLLCTAHRLLCNKASKAGMRRKGKLRRQWKDSPHQSRRHGSSQKFQNDKLAGRSGTARWKDLVPGYECVLTLRALCLL